MLATYAHRLRGAPGGFLVVFTPRNKQYSCLIPHAVHMQMGDELVIDLTGDSQEIEPPRQPSPTEVRCGRSRHANPSILPAHP
jgi:hypothetical protein